MSKSLDETNLDTRIDEILTLPSKDRAKQSIKQLIEETNIKLFNFCREVVGADDSLLPNELPDENGQVLGTWATHRNQLRMEQRERLNRKLGDM